jgi:hypothetical protein
MKSNHIQTKRWIWAGLVTAIVAAYVPLAHAGAVPGESCGLGPPPDAPGFAEFQKQQKAEALKNGFLRVCEANLERYNISFASLERAYQGLAFAPVDLAKTPFAHFKSLGGMAEAVNETKSRLYRGFRIPGGHTLTLFEHDMSADGTRMGRDPADEPERINGKPARLYVLQAGSGKAISNLSWREGRRYYELWIDANVAHSPLREQLFAWAGSLPASTPACPKEIPPKPVEMGPDGKPIDEPIPAVIIVNVDMNGHIVESERPCK